MPARCWLLLSSPLVVVVVVVPIPFVCVWGGCECKRVYARVCVCVYEGMRRGQE